MGDNREGYIRSEESEVRSNVAKIRGGRVHIRTC
jgi:hypothetical protein